jgi:exopolysaccharide production protein ExoZ
LFWPYSNADGSMQPLYGLGWTLNYEMMFYLLFALSLPLSRRLSRSIVIAALVVLVVAGQLFANAGTAFWFWSRPIILEFGLGVGLASLWLAGWRPGRITGAGLIFAGLTALLVLQVLGTGLDRLFVAGMPMTLVLAGSLSFSGSGEATSHGATSHGATSRLAARIGDASYALYLLHPFVLKGLLIVVGARVMAVSPWLHLCIATILAIIASVLVWRYFERPLTRALQGPPLPR